MGKYDDIINLPHHVSATRPHMSRTDRAAQFAPFAALTGHEEAIQETARLTDRRVELGESEKSVLNEKMQMLQDRISERPFARVTYFSPDQRKEGGAYLTVAGNVRRIDEVARRVIFSNQIEIPMDDIMEIESEEAVYAE